MTEDEARQKWCPFVRFTHPFTVKSDDHTKSRKAYDRWNNRNTDIESGSDDNANCIASNCMMWRWKTGVDHGGTGTVTLDTGYCGLEGK